MAESGIRRPAARRPPPRRGGNPYAGPVLRRLLPPPRRATLLAGSRTEALVFSKLLVPLDRSLLAEQAIGPAASIARGAHAGIDFALVHEPMPLGGFHDAPWLEEQLGAEHRYVESIAAEIATGASVATTCAVLRGAPADMIRERALAIGADLIVMTSHGRTGFSRAWLGSVADAVMRSAAIPVLMLRPSADHGGRRTIDRKFTRLLVPLDGSPLAASVVPIASAFARATGASITLLQVSPTVPLVLPYDVAMPPSYLPTVADDAATADLADRTKRELGEVAQRLRAESGATVSAEVVVSDRVATAIVDFVRGHSVDVVAMSTHGRGASRWLLGSVADKVVRASGVATLIHRPVGIPAEAPLIDSSSVEQQLAALNI